ncbi:hypothetical protein ACLMJK_004120 [Lecanora helva]
MSSPAPSSTSASQPQTTYARIATSHYVLHSAKASPSQVPRLYSQYSRWPQNERHDYLHSRCAARNLDSLFSPIDTPLLVPLTTSLYVPGILASTSTVLIDIGTGFYVEKTPDEAQHFYKRKVEDLGKNLGDLEKIVRGKEGNLGVVEDGEFTLFLVQEEKGEVELILDRFAAVLRQKVIAETSKGGGSGDESNK